MLVVIYKKSLSFGEFIFGRSSLSDSLQCLLIHSRSLIYLDDPTIRDSKSQKKK